MLSMWWWISPLPLTEYWSCFLSAWHLSFAKCCYRDPVGSIKNGLEMKHYLLYYYFLYSFLLHCTIFHLIFDCARNDIFGFTLIILQIPKLMIHTPPVLFGLSRNENLSPYIILICIINLLVIWGWAPSKLPARMTHEMGHMPDGSYGKAYDPSVIFLVSFFPLPLMHFFQN